MQSAINAKPFALMKILLTALQFLVCCLPLPAQEAKSKTKANQANTDDMWVASLVPELPAGVTHHTFRSDAMKRDVGYCL
jgi:hypothetical protein